MILCVKINFDRPEVCLKLLTGNAFINDRFLLNPVLVPAPDFRLTIQAMASEYRFPNKISSGVLTDTQVWRLG